MDFHAEAFSAAINGKQGDVQSCLITDTVWKATLTASKDTIYSGACRIVPKGFFHEKPVVVLSPVQSNIPVQKPKKYRSERVKPVPSLHISFQHPLRASEKINCPILLVFWPGYGVASMASYNQYETIGAPCIQTKI
ncbi:MAG: hypothetical protein U9Q05_08845, partial [Thermodesulfobacteriota bacterium]|nr:hypothetical protein [Thermodesulfobacteriota bacterium]